MALGTSNGPSAASGTKLWIGTTASDKLADTYTVVGSLESVGDYGPSFDDITFEDLSEGTKQHNKGARDDGTLDCGLGQDVDDAGQAAAFAALDSKNYYNFKIEFADAAPARSFVCTISNASPAVVTKTGHALAADTAVSFTTTGTLPTGLTPSTTYYVKTVLDADTFTLAATKGGSAINTSGAGSGTHTLTTIPSNTMDYFKAIVSGFVVNTGNLQSVVKNTLKLGLKSGTRTRVKRLPAVVKDS